MARWLSLAFVLAVACGGDINPKTLNEPCTRTDQCVEGLVCLSGVCLEDDEGEGDTAESPSTVPR